MRDYIEKEIQAWLRSPERAAQITAARYLAGKHDILTRERRVIGRGGQLETSRNLPNNRLVDNQYGKLVRQKVNYLTGRPFTFEGDAGAALSLSRFFDKRRRRTIHSVCEDAVSAGIGWLMPCFDGRGRFWLKRIPPYEILPFWADGEHTVLDCAVRVYESEWNRKRVRRAEIYTPAGLSRYLLEGDKLLPGGNARMSGSGDGSGQGVSPLSDDAFAGGPWLSVNGRAWGWGKVPLVAFRSRGEESLLSRVKTLQDALNALLSDFQNCLQEDARNTILVLKNYDGKDLAEFRHNLAAYGAVRVKTVDNTQGGVETLRVEVNHRSYEALSAMLKRAIVENGMGFDMRSELARSAPNQMALLSMYSDVELDAHALEAEWKASFEELLGFVRVGMMLESGVTLHAQRTLGAARPADSQISPYPPCGAAEQLEVVFNRDMLMNESEIMRTLLQAGLRVSNESLLEQVPWVRDAGAEMERLRREQA
ncbi:MAG: phage portal protein [Oscillospiraceae bacterium]|jgi:SPP1 family phage portal protein|nr:phage portal protein [Oscillospiraceae bacterium]